MRSILIDPKTRIMWPRLDGIGSRSGDTMRPPNGGTHSMLDAAKLGRFVDQIWGDAIVPTLVDYIRIPNKSPAFDPEWAAHGYMEEAVAMFERWARAEIAALPGASLEIVRLPGRTPLMLIEVPGEGSDTVLLYGHLDKQPTISRSEEHTSELQSPYV